MAISSYPRTIKNGQIASNGDANSGTGLMLWDSATNSYIAATPATFGAAAGGATAALQTTLNALVSTKALQISQAAALAAETNGGILVDTFATQSLTVSMTALAVSQACKSVTLINLSTNAKFTYTIGTSGAILTLEGGYSVKINIASSNNIQIAQTTGEGQIAQIIITS
jgi:hypothetical protein